MAKVLSCRWRVAPSRSLRCMRRLPSGCSYLVCLSRWHLNGRKQFNFAFYYEAEEFANKDTSF